MSKAESLNPREFQINQLRRRFRPAENDDDSGTVLTFGIAPSDPDFPFELDQLQCILHVPRSYPNQGRPTLRVTNPEMERAFQANVERGFDDIVNTTFVSGGRGTLLGWMNSLDKQLERFLTTLERGPTLKFVANVAANDTSGDKGAQREQKRARSEVPVDGVSISGQPKTARSPVPTYTAEEKANAERRRTTETKQIEARLNRLPLFQKRPDEVSFTIPVQATKPDRLPVPLRSIKTVKLLVPQLYPLEPSSIELQGVEKSDARPVEVGFMKWAKENANLNLMSQINYLASNMHSLAKTSLEPDPIPTSQPDLGVHEEPSQPAAQDSLVGSDDRTHIHIVPRPPEWMAGDTADSSDDDVSDESTSENFTEDDEEGGAPVPAPSDQTPGRGVALSFPSLEFHGIELLDLVALSVTIKCERCKEHLDVKNVPQTKDQNDSFSPRVESCKKCANSMSIGRFFILS